MDGFRAAHRAYNAARRAIAKKMQVMGFRIDIWTKRDKGRTIVQIYGNDPVSLETTVDTMIAWANAQYGPKMAMMIPAYGDVAAHVHQREIKHFGVEVRGNGEFSVTVGG